MSHSKRQLTERGRIRRNPPSLSESLRSIRDRLSAWFVSRFVEPISPTILPRHNSGSLYVSSCRKSWGRCEAASLNFANPRLVAKSCRRCVPSCNSQSGAAGASCRASRPTSPKWFSRRDGSPGTRSAMLLPGRTSCVARRWSPIKRRARRMWKLTCGPGCRRPECGIRVGRGTRGL